MLIKLFLHQIPASVGLKSVYLDVVPGSKTHDRTVIGY